MDTRFRLFPESASTVARQVDFLYAFLLGVAAFFTLLIFVLIVYFALKYRRGAQVDRRLSSAGASWILELTWSLIPLGLTFLMFGWGAELYLYNHQPPADCLEINVVAKQWMWKIQHPDGRQEINELHVPEGQPVKLRMISEDVIHSFYVPSFRLKQDVLPSRYTTLWFQATRPGRYHLFCAEYCGTSHSRMTGQVVVLPPSQYVQWLQGGPALSPEEAGRRAFEQFRCHTCHTGIAEARCPPLDGIFGRRVRLTDGRTIVADEDYLRESILEPAAKVVAGYQPLMPVYRGQISEETLLEIVAYLKSLPALARSSSPPPSEPSP